VALRRLGLKVSVQAWIIQDLPEAAEFSEGVMRVHCFDLGGYHGRVVRSI
jgi:hypothetical protein